MSAERCSELARRIYDAAISGQLPEGHEAVILVFARDGFGLSATSGLASKEAVALAMAQAASFIANGEGVTDETERRPRRKCDA